MSPSSDDDGSPAEPQSLQSLFDDADPSGGLSEEEQGTAGLLPGEDDAADSAASRPPWWAVLSVSAAVLSMLALLPGVLTLVFPPFAVYLVKVAKAVVWLSPLLLIGNAASLGWAFPRQRPVVTALSMLGFLHVLVCWAVLILAKSAEDPITVLGIPFGGQ